MFHFNNMFLFTSRLFNWPHNYQTYCKQQTQPDNYTNRSWTLSIKALTSNLVKLTSAERCARGKLLSGYPWCALVLPFKVTDFYTNRKPVYDFLWVINFNLSFTVVTSRFRDNNFYFSRSLKVIDLCTNRNPISDFLLVINCNLDSNSYRFRHNAEKEVENHPALIWAPISSHFIVKLTRRQTTYDSIRTLLCSWKLCNCNVCQT